MSSKHPWWSDAVTYQLYVRSFYDSNGDGRGDLAGIRARLGYLQQLGIDAIWLNPCYPSPQKDHGYDVSDHFSIEPDYGDLAEFDRLVADAKDHDIRILMDVVPNHVSDQHPWFIEALAARPGSAARERFWFRDGRGIDGSEPPNNWNSIFGGRSWTRIVEPDGTPGQWYLHIFDSSQPDLNWDNPEVADLFDRMLRFWFDRGVAGFRCDAVAVVGKEAGLPDYNPDEAREIGNENPHHTFHPTGHAHWQRWRTVTDEYQAEHGNRDLLLISEAYTHDTETLLAYVNDHEFHQSFAFDLMMTPWNATAIKGSIAETLDALTPHGLSPAWTLNNHDAQRAVTRRGRADATELTTGNNLLNSDAAVDIELGNRRARAITLVQLALPGSVFLYNGEELGLPEVLDMPAEARQDPVFIRTEGRELGRDGCRVPLPWTTDPSTSFGFSAVAGEAPWLPQPDDWGRYAMSTQDADDDSTLSFYRAAVAARRAHHNFRGQPFAWLDCDVDDIVAFTRGDTLAVLNTGATERRLPSEIVAGRVPVFSSSSSELSAGSVPPNTAIWLDRRPT